MYYDNTKANLDRFIQRKKQLQKDVDQDILYEMSGKRMPDLLS